MPSLAVYSRTNPHHAYNRIRDLPRVLGVWPQEIGNTTQAGHQWICRQLAQALRRERQLGLAGHWAYDLGRHAGLLSAYRAEKAALEAQSSDSKMPAKPAGQITACGRRADAATTSPVGCRAPFSSPVATVLPHNLAPPSDNRAAAPTSRDILPAISCSASGCGVLGI